MTQSSRTTESISKDYAAIRDIMHQVKELTVPDRATLALGLVGHLATLMNRRQMAKLMAELQEEAERVQDVPPSRARDQEDRAAAANADADAAIGPRRGAASEGSGALGAAASDDGRGEARDARSVGQSGRGEFRSRELL